MTTPTMESRTAQLDPEVRKRGLLGMSRTMVTTWAVTAFVAVLAWMALGGLLGAVGGFAVLGLTWITTKQFAGGPSYAQRVLLWGRDRLRRRSGEHIYFSVADRGDRTGQPSEDYNPDADPAWERPVPVGRAEPLDLTGTGFDGLFIVRHANPGEGAYLSCVVQVQGLKGGLRSAPAYAASWQSYGYVLAQLAKPESFIRGLQQLHRSVAYDLTPHLEWYQNQIVGDDGRLEKMVDSYWSNLEQIRPLAEEHRVWYVLKFPLDGQFLSEAASRDQWGEHRRAEIGWASVVKDELERFEQLVRGAGMGEVTVLGEHRTCAVIRALMDPSYALDDDRDAPDWESCWQSYFGDQDYVLINNRWYTRVAHVPPGGLTPTPLGPLWLHPLLVGVPADEGGDDQPRSATVRTICVRMDFTPDYAAREQATSDLTQDAAVQASEGKKGKIDDGSTEVMMSASVRRRRDLMPGSGIHGVTWSMWVAVTGRDPDDVRRACMRVTSAASDSAITKLDWQTNFHDVAQVATLPLCRGMAGSAPARTA
ncbi:Uncharacterised protein [Nocardia otitidiscaviarum]|uniref:Type IV secretory pathway, VirB4 components n=1 Tax=Nocardia otitidiscaviarum TaxID=1823 RepID=A0A379JLV0_9NOCA|nr:hypothetical protein [Nocardia otitidiscaviarum]SUD49582.1 Uncharacterised protein [Nocardia otitidiscaviarum]